MTKKISFNQMLHRLNNIDLLGERAFIVPAPKKEEKKVEVEKEEKPEVVEEKNEKVETPEVKKEEVKVESKEEVKEGRRLLSTHTNGNKTAKVYKDAEWNEHRVTLHVDGVHQKGADYHADSKEDAVGTAKKMIESEEVKENNDDVPSYSHKDGKDKRASRFLTKKKFKSKEVKEDVGLEAPEAVTYSSASTHEADRHYDHANEAKHRYFQEHSDSAKNPLDAVIYHANMAKHHEHMAKVSTHKNQPEVAKAHLKSMSKFVGHLKHYSGKA